MKNTRKIKIIMFFICLYGMSISNVLAEDTLYMYYGLYGGYGINMHNANFNKISDTCFSCNPLVYGTNMSGGFSAGLLLEYPLSLIDIYKPLFSIGLRAGITDISGKFIVEDAAIGNMLGKDGLPINGLANHIFESKIYGLTFTPYLSYHIMRNFVINVGANIGYLIEGKFSQREELVSPDDVVYTETGTRVYNKYDNLDIPKMNKIQYGVFVGLGYDLPIGKYSVLSPEVSITIPLNNINNLNWNVFALRGGIALKLPITKNKQKDTIQKGTITTDTLEGEHIVIIQKDTHIVIQKPNDTTIIKKTDTLKSTYGKRIVTSDTTVEKRTGIKEPGIMFKDSTVSFEGKDTIIHKHFVRLIPQGSVYEQSDTTIEVRCGVQEYIEFKNVDTTLQGIDTIITYHYTEYVDIVTNEGELKRSYDAIPTITIEQFAYMDIKEACCSRIIFHDDNDMEGNVNNIFTGIHKAGLSEKGKKVLKDFAVLIRSKATPKDVEIFVIGHTDSSGTVRDGFDTTTNAGMDSSYKFINGYPKNKKPFNNGKLSFDRATAVQVWLYKSGLDGFSMVIDGESCYLPRKDVNEKWSLTGMRTCDRRVDIIIKCKEEE